MEPEEGGAIKIGLTTPNADSNEPLLVELGEDQATVVTTEYAMTTLTIGAKEATQTVGIVKIDVTDTLLI